MLPEAKYQPAGVLKCCVDPSIASPVPLQLRFPVADVRPGHPAVLGAAVPEASIYENCHPFRREHDIGFDADVIDPQQMVLSKPEPPAVEQRAKLYLWDRVGPAVAPADPACLGRGRLRIRDPQSAAQSHGPPHGNQPYGSVVPNLLHKSACDTKIVAMPTLGRLTPLDPRTVWKNEAYDFTPWLLDNADALAETLGIEIEITAAEHPVGPFSLDLVGRDNTNDCVLIVENQLTATDHGHLRPAGHLRSRD